MPPGTARACSSAQQSIVGFGPFTHVCHFRHSHRHRLTKKTRARRTQQAFLATHQRLAQAVRASSVVPKGCGVEAPQSVRATSRMSSQSWVRTCVKNASALIPFHGCFGWWPCDVTPQGGFVVRVSHCFMFSLEVRHVDLFSLRDPLGWLNMFSLKVDVANVVTVIGEVAYIWNLKTYCLVLMKTKCLASFRPSQLGDIHTCSEAHITLTTSIGVSNTLVSQFDMFVRVEQT